MTKQMVFLPSRIIHGKPAFIKGRKLETGFKHLLRESKAPAKALTILSVHGSLAFNTCLVTSAPKGTQVTRLTSGLREFRSEPCFDLLFYPVPQDLTDLQNLLEDLCYCRMLLRPGAFLFLVSKGNRASRLCDYFTITKREEVSWLRWAGFMKIISQKMDNGVKLFGGQRPLKNFSDR